MLHAQKQSGYNAHSFTDTDPAKAYTVILARCPPTWQLVTVAKEVGQLNGFVQRVYRRGVKMLFIKTSRDVCRLMLGSRPTDHVRMTSACEVLHMLPLRVHLDERTLTWAARMFNLPIDRLPRLVMHSQLAEGKRNCGRPTARWSDSEICAEVGLPATLS